MADPRSFKDWTLADIARISARPPQGARIGHSALPTAINNKGGLESPRNGLIGQSATVGKADTRHKYRAEPCIVTPDLTLFTKPDLEQLFKLSRGFQPIREWSLKELAQTEHIIGEWFGSTKEGRRWIALRQLEAAGAIARLKRQQWFELSVPHTNLRGDVDADRAGRMMVIAHYVADFCYDELSAVTTQCVVEDCKGIKTPMYKRSKKHFEAQYGIKIRET